MRIDLHTHSDRSDGTLPPDVVIAEAARAGLDVVALTDHDSFDGWGDAAEAARVHGVTLVRGVEVSCRYAGHGVHLLGYLPDPTYAPLTTELQRILDGRNLRLPRILERLRDRGIDITLEDVRAVSHDATATGRPHVADALVRLGVVQDRTEAFVRYLGPGGPAYVDRYAADLVAMIGLLRDAGGVSVVAHPWSGRHDQSALSAEAFSAFREAGLAGIEVDHQDHDPTTRSRLADLARELDLVATGSSDFHGAGKVDHDLGVNTTAPEQFERLMDLARAARAAAGRGSDLVPV